MKRILAVALLALGLSATGAKADPIGPDNCVNNSCFGGIYTLEFATVSATEYLVRLLVDITNPAAPLTLTDYIQGVSIKPASAILATSSLVSTTAPGTWTYLAGGLDAGGCNGNGGGFACADSADALALVGSTYEWIFDIKVADAGKWLLAPGAASIKVNYDPQGHLVSEPITFQHNQDCCIHDVPEPQPLLLLGLGLFALVAIRRRFNT